MPTKIKGFRQKQSDGSFGSFKPFGTDGILIDMLSGLDNEQELKLGGNHSSTIVESINDQNEPVTTITEFFKDNNTPAIVTYILITTITEHEDNTITIVCKIYDTDQNMIADHPLNQKTITIPNDDGIGDFTIEEVLN